MKILTKDNWQNVDPICEQMLAISLEQMSAYPMFPDLWFDLILKPKLSEDVPIELHSIFETARGCMVYGYFYYPLFSIGVEQLYKLIDAAITEKYVQCGGPRSNPFNKLPTLNKKIDWLFRNQFITDEQKSCFHYARLARNEAFHPTAQGIMPPATASSSLGLSSLWINELFS